MVYVYNEEDDDFEAKMDLEDLKDLVEDDPDAEEYSLYNAYFDSAWGVDKQAVDKEIKLAKKRCEKRRLRMV